MVVMGAGRIAVVIKLGASIRFVKPYGVVANINAHSSLQDRSRQIGANQQIHGVRMGNGSPKRTAPGGAPHGVAECGGMGPEPKLKTFGIASTFVGTVMKTSTEKFHHRTTANPYGMACGTQGGGFRPVHLEDRDYPIVVNGERHTVHVYSAPRAPEVEPGVPRHVRAIQAE